LTASNSPSGAKAPARVVSLVPSITESLFDLGLSDRLVGITDYCVHPADGVRGLPRLGGTKNPRCDEIIALRPDLVMANQEENRAQDVARLRAAGLQVWVTFPRTLRQALDVLWEIVRRFEATAMSVRLLPLEHTLAWTRAAAGDARPVSVFCPIWREPPAGAGNAKSAWWMTINADTCVSDLLAVCGGRNVFAGRERRYPLAADLAQGGNGGGRTQSADGGERDVRYPRVTLDEIVAAQPEVILLPSEPYAFGEEDRAEWMRLGDLPAVRDDRVHLVDGSLLTWHGTRMARALQEIPPLLAD